MSRFLFIKIICFGLILSTVLVLNSAVVEESYEANIYFNINSGITKIDEPVELDITWRDSFFIEDSYKYNHNLATISMMLSASAYASAGEESVGNLKNSLNSIGFKDALFVNYDGYGEEASDIAGYSLAHKPVRVAGGEKELILIVIRGTTGDEWLSNFNIGMDDDHLGFKSASDKIYVRLKEYIKNNNLNNINFNKILITGHSRGAAIANLLAARLNKDQEFAIRENIFAYTFATPNVTTDKAVNDDEYKNIFNIINSEDFIPNVPLSDKSWGYWKYGNTLVFPVKTYYSGNEKYGLKASEEFKLLTGKELIHYENGFYSVQCLNQIMLQIAPAIDDFYNKKHTVSNSDMTPNELFIKIAGQLSGRGNNIMELMTFSNLLKNPIYGKLINFIKDEEQNILYAHAPETYIAWMKSLNGDFIKLDNTKYKKITITGPVNIEIYDEEGHLFVKTADNSVIEKDSNRMGINVDGEVKTVFIPVLEKEKFIIRFLYTEEGEFNYKIETMNLVSPVINEQKEFLNVQLLKNTEMCGEIGKMGDTKLCLVNHNEAEKEEIFAEKVKGDIDGNGVIEINDVILLLRYLADLEELTEEQKFSVNVKGEPQIDDAITLMQYIAGIINEIYNP